MRASHDGKTEWAAVGKWDYVNQGSGRVLKVCSICRPPCNPKSSLKSSQHSPTNYPRYLSAWSKAYGLYLFRIVFPVLLHLFRGIASWKKILCLQPQEYSCLVNQGSGVVKLAVHFQLGWASSRRSLIHCSISQTGYDVVSLGL